MPSRAARICAESLGGPPAGRWPRYPRSVTALRRTFMRLVWLTVLAFGGGLDAYAQTVSSEPWWDDLLVREEFTEAYRRARDRAAAEAMLQGDPFSVEAVALLVRAKREDDALDLVERVAHARPDLPCPPSESSRT